MRPSESPPFDPAAVARIVLEAQAVGGPIAPFTDQDAGFALEAAYAAGALVRRARVARGERPIGRKIGFTNRTIWDEYDVHAPIWGAVYDTTVIPLTDLDGGFDLSGLAEPRIEPEIVLHLARAPEPGMDALALLSCIDWVAHGFEIVQSLYPGWRFRAPDTVAAFGLHGALLLGPPRPIVPAERAGWIASLAGFEIALSRDDALADRGRAADVLGGGPLAALAHLVVLLGGGPEEDRLAPGEIVSTGTLTRALPVAPGERWSTRLDGLALDGIAVRFR